MLVGKAPVPSDETFVNSLAEHIRKRGKVMSVPAHMYVETAGGEHCFDLYSAFPNFRAY